MAIRRIEREIQELIKDPYYNIYYFMEKVNPNEPFHCCGWILGTEFTPYENGKFCFNIHFPSDYPFKPFKFSFRTKIYHVSISPDGILCCCNWPELSLNDGWNPTFTALKIFKLIRERLGNYPRTCIRNKLASYVYSNDKNEFLKIAREYTENYAICKKKDIWDDYIKGDLIEVGSFGEVYYAINKKNQNKVAVKIIRIGNNPEERKLIENEIDTLKLVKSNILIDSFIDDLNAYLVMELYDDNLENIFNKRNSGFSYKEIKNILREMNSTFKELQQNKIMHGDLKLNNILIKYKDEEKKNFNVALSDFGLSQTISSSKSLHKKGNYLTISPEVVNAEEGEKGHFQKADLWSIGIIIYQLYFHEYPFNLKEKNTYGILNKLMIGKKLNVPNEDDLAELLNRLLVVNPEERISWDDYFNHVFFK